MPNKATPPALQPEKAEFIGQTPHEAPPDHGPERGVPPGAAQADPKAAPTKDRLKTEAAPASLPPQPLPPRK